MNDKIESSIKREILLAQRKIPFEDSRSQFIQFSGLAGFNVEEILVVFNFV